MVVVVVVVLTASPYPSSTGILANVRILVRYKGLFKQSEKTREQSMRERDVTLSNRYPEGRFGLVWRHKYLINAIKIHNFYWGKPLFVLIFGLV